MLDTIWIEKYRPKKLDDVICKDKDKIWKLCADPQKMPSFLFYGPAGTGKTTMSFIIKNDLGADVLTYNGSDDTSIDTIRDRVKNFIASKSMKKGIPKLVIIQEADMLSKSAQNGLRAMMEEYHRNARFIFTLNHIHKVEEPLKSRCVNIEFRNPDRKSIREFLTNICTSEKVMIENEALSRLIEYNYPDIRKMVNKLQEASESGTVKIADIKREDDDYRQVYSMIIEKKYKDARTFWIEKALDIRVLLKNLFLYFHDSGHDSMPKIVYILAETDKAIRLGADEDIQMSACVMKIIEVI